MDNNNELLNFEDIEFPEMEFSDINLDDFDLSLGSIKIESRIHKPRKQKPRKLKYINYDNAEKLSIDLGWLEPYDRYFCFIAGNFIFGDFLEAYIVDRDIKVKRMVVSTLSYSVENVDSLYNLLDGGYIDKLDLLVSEMHFSRDKHKVDEKKTGKIKNTIKYALDVLDRDNKFNLCVSANHCKIVLIEAENGEKIVIHGSSNLRSSDCIEQICIENNPELYDFNLEFLTPIIENFSIIDKNLEYDEGEIEDKRKYREIALSKKLNKTFKGNRGKKLWQELEENLRKKK